MRKNYSLLHFLLSFVLLAGCGRSTKQAVPDETTRSAEVAQPVAPDTYSVTTFAITDSVTGANTGYGYDILVNGKRVIHQPVIPAVQGTNAFSTEEKARRAGEFAAQKMRRTGSLPVLTTGELDSLKVL